MLDGCGIETSSLRLWPSRRDQVAIDARWLWNRDSFSIDASADADGIVAIDARWLWNRDGDSRRGDEAAQGGSRSMLDGCGIETLACSSLAARLSGRDRCSMAVESRLPRRSANSASARCVAIDARWLWNRNCWAAHQLLMPWRGRDRCSMAVESRLTWFSPPATIRPGRDRCSMAVESRQNPELPPGTAAVESRSMLDGCGIETSLPCGEVYPR